MLVVGKALDKMESWKRKDELDRIAAMLSQLGKRGYQAREDQAAYSVDSEPDSDFDPEERKSQQTDALDTHSSPRCDLYTAQVSCNRSGGP
ncbi:MAG: hypothetical protein R6Y91_02555 [Desulfohalobium sp.]